MKKMLKSRKSLTVALTLALTFSLLITSAFAAWPVYGGNDNHNAVVTGAPTSSSAGANAVELALLNAGTGWDGIDNVPVMQTLNKGTANEVTYAYVLYDGHAAYGHLAKINCNTGTKVWDKQVTTASGFQLSTPLLVQGSDPDSESDDAIYIGASSASQVLNPISAPVTVNPGTPQTVSQSGFSIASTATNRVAMGIYIGTSPTTTATATVSWNLNGTTGSKNFASGDLLQDGNTGKYYFFLNENIGTVSSASPNSISFTVSMSNASGTIQYAELYQQTAGVQKIMHLDATGTVVSGSVDLPTSSPVTAGTAISGQINTPITTDGTYIYFGSWSGGTAVGKYYQVKMSDNSITTYTPADYGFYWAGAVITGGYVYFVSDGGYLHYCPVNNFSAGTRVALPSVSGNAPGDARSTIMLDGSDLYFTSKGSSIGNFYCYTIGSGGVPALSWAVKLSGTIAGTSTTVSGNCTSTPVKADSGNIYVGFYSGFSNGGLMKVERTGTSSSGTAIPITVGGAQFDQPVQCTPVVMTKVESRITYDYFYFNTNSATGAGYCFKVEKSASNAAQIWKTAADTYALGGMACENGYMVFGNDFNHFYIVHD
jgi:hypothetical protein